MKKFLYKIALFLAIPIFYLMANAAINYFTWKNQQVDLHEKTILIAGDSHPISSLNPKLFYSARNICQSAEPYVLTYWKLKNILKTNKVDTLILGFAPHNISGFNDLKFSDKLWSREMFRRSYFLINFRNLINESIPVDFFTYLDVLFDNTFLYPEKDHIHYIGSFSERKGTHLSDSLSAISRHFYYKGMELGVSKASITYLDSIINYCKQQNTTIILSSNPVHRSYYERIPDNILDSYYYLKDKYSKDGIFVFDKTNSFLADSLYYNSDHLNRIGAQYFTKELIETIKTQQTKDTIQ